MSPNPYQPPAAPYGAGPWPPPGPPNAPPALFTPNAIALATFLGSPIAGGLLYAANLRRLGRDGQAISAAVIGLVAAGVVFGLAFTLPDKLTNLMTFVNLGLVSGARALAQRDFAPTIATAGAWGVQPRSTWWAAGVALGLLVPIAAVAIGIVMATEKSVTVAPDQTIVYQGDATEAEAKAVGADLVRLGMFGPKSPGEKSAILDKDGGKISLSFYVDDDAWKKPSTQDAFRCVGGYVRSHALGKAPTSVLLLDSLAQEKWRAVAPLDGDADYAAACGGPAGR